ncbi:MAG: hypothetical protein IJ503_07020 [Akkermansia sp.]|nr:hypothetical protein [Akkermansia sp.]
MKAIDFACNLLKTLHESELSPASIRVLFCLGAGLHYKDDITSFLSNSQNSGNISTILKRLEQHKLVKLISSDTDYYSLSEKGKDAIRKLLRFLPTH